MLEIVGQCKIKPHIQKIDLATLYQLLCTLVPLSPNSHVSLHESTSSDYMNGFTVSKSAARVVIQYLINNVLRASHSRSLSFCLNSSVWI